MFHARKHSCESGDFHGDESTCRGHLGFDTWYITTQSRDSSVGVSIRLRAERSGFQVPILGGGWEFFSLPPFPELFCSPPSLLSSGY